MSSTYRLIERLPPEIFDNLVPDDQGDDGAATGAMLQRRICNKLKSFTRKYAGRTKHRGIKYVGDFLKLSEIDLVHGLDPLLTFGKIRVGNADNLSLSLFESNKNSL